MASMASERKFQEMWPFLQRIEAKWEELANRLKIDRRNIENIRANCFAGANNKDSCKRMLSHWLNATSKDKRTWSKIKEAAVSLQRNDLVESLVAAGVNDAGEPSMIELYDHVIPKITEDWYEFGIKLDICGYSKLNNIKKDYCGGGGNKECMRLVVDHWLKVNPDACWEDVITALNDMKETSFVEEVKKYIAQLKDRLPLSEPHYKEELPAPSSSVVPQQDGRGLNHDLIQLPPITQNQPIPLPVDTLQGLIIGEGWTMSMPSIESNQEQNVKDVLRSFNIRLVEVLPMTDSIFISKLNAAGLFHGDLKATVQSLSTSADKAAYFIDKAILPDVTNNRTNLNQLLTVMEQFDNDAVKNLAVEIQKALDQI